MFEKVFNFLIGLCIFLWMYHYVEKNKQKHKIMSRRLTWLMLGSIVLSIRGLIKWSEKYGGKKRRM